ncbi:MAG: hypothetical protein ACREVN_02755 [Gammaproteobacteria bacterium]
MHDGEEASTSRWPAIETLLARGRRRRLPGAGLPGAIEWLSDGSLLIDKGWPAAPVGRLGEGLAPSAGWWLRADPVHLLPFGDRLQLLPAGNLEGPASDALVGAFNAHFEADGYRLEAPHAERWYLRAPRPLRIDTCAPGEAAVRDVYDCMPTGADAALAARLMTEAQMIFHAAGGSAGDPPVNGLWLWGGGELPQRRAAPLPPLWSDEPFVRGVWLLTGNSVRALPGTAAECLALQEADGFAAFGTFDVARRNEATSTLESSWCAPLVAALGRGQVAELDLLPGGAERFELTRAGARRFWRRRRPLTGERSPDA